jgi:hypothetical protein
VPVIAEKYTVGDLFAIAQSASVRSIAPKRGTQACVARPVMSTARRVMCPAAAQASSFLPPFGKAAVVNASGGMTWRPPLLRPDESPALLWSVDCPTAPWRPRRRWGTAGARSPTPVRRRPWRGSETTTTSWALGRASRRAATVSSSLPRQRPGWGTTATLAHRHPRAPFPTAAPAVGRALPDNSRVGLVARAREEGSETGDRLGWLLWPLDGDGGWWEGARHWIPSPLTFSGRSGSPPIWGKTYPFPVAIW